MASFDRIQLPRTLLFGALLAVAVPLGPALAQCPTAQFQPPGASAGDQAGLRVAVDGDWAMISNPGDDENGTDAGAVHVYNWSGGAWVYHSKLFGADTEAGDAFGFRLDVDGTRLAVGATFEDTVAMNAGAVYVFELSGGVWSETAKITAADGASADELGLDTVLDGDRILAGARRLAAAKGAAYFFTYDGASWNLEQKVVASDGEKSDFFGVSCALEGNEAVIGARYEDGPAFNSGSAYAFRFDGAQWNEVQKLNASDGASQDLFATELAMDGGVLLVSAHNDDPKGTNSGSAYVFRLDSGTWVEEAKLVPAVGGTGDQFSVGLGLSGDLAVLSAHLSDDVAPDGGAFHVFQRSGTSWSELGKITSPNPASSAQFGYGTAIDAGRIVVGAFGENGGAGAAYGYTTVPGDCAPLNVDVPTVSLSAGGTQVFSLQPGLPDAGTLYLLLGTTNGDTPGTPWGPFLVPLNPSQYFTQTLVQPGAAPLSNSFSVLNAFGSGEAQFTLAPGTSPSLAGLTAHHAYVLLDLTSPILVDFVSNAVTVDLVP